MYKISGEQLPGNSADVFLVGRVDAITPVSGLNVEFVPVREHASGQEVVLNEVEGAFDTSGAIGVAALMGHEAKAEALAKGGHLGHGDHVASRCAQDDDVRIIDHDSLGCAAEVARGVR